ncbi:undecaprenyl-phosphate glucose phosphotransferase [Buttiauxella sp. B2]|uniref:undecaprenyl-phosphate glucose phosphotransferase n=1 Tax=Buttiauxella sp. B2 TaxID=2587812 RepID=UPI00111F35CC|nr:undecaprenyl-phosphate glucose phosphotransferase [Buttiauxella sp. B2]TNV22972.1 undecaprenyl-phosphate glucose phosphotransferase [Buttiauxella sp. B2]
MLKNSLKFTHGGYPVFIKLADFIVINAVLILSALLLAIESISTIIMLNFIFSTSFLLFGEYTGLYLHKPKNMNIRGQLRLILCAFFTIVFVETIKSLTGGLQSLGYLSVLDNRFFPATLVWYSIPLFLLLIIHLSFLKYSSKKNIRVAIVGVTPNGLAAEHALLKEYSNMKLDMAFYDERDASRFNDLINQMDSPFKGSVSGLVEEAKAGRVDEIYIALPLVALERIRHFLSMMSDTTVDTYIVPDFNSYSTHMSQLRSIHNLQTISILSSPFEGVGSFIKRAEDLVLGSVIMVLISSLLLVIGIGIKLTSRGPVFFKQDRYGLSGQKIKVWKFRTMRVMENSDTVVQATKGDPRVTRFGAFLRRTSLDELPQFFNVLQGSMSIVGPRPHAVTHNEQYRKQVENYMIRHKVKPGITGLAQINGYRGEIDALYKMEKRVQYDIEYIQNWSLWLDIKIIIKTIFKGFVGKNAY